MLGSVPSDPEARLLSGHIKYLQQVIAKATTGEQESIQGVKVSH